MNIKQERKTMNIKATNIKATIKKQQEVIDNKLKLLWASFNELEQKMKSYEQIAERMYTAYALARYSNALIPSYRALVVTDKKAWVEAAKAAYREITECIDSAPST